MGARAGGSGHRSLGLIARVVGPALLLLVFAGVARAGAEEGEAPRLGAIRFTGNRHLADGAVAFGDALAPADLVAAIHNPTLRRLGLSRGRPARGGGALSRRRLPLRPRLRCGGALQRERRRGANHGDGGRGAAHSPGGRAAARAAGSLGEGSRAPAPVCRAGCRFRGQPFLPNATASAPSAPTRGSPSVGPSSPCGYAADTAEVVIDVGSGSARPRRFRSRSAGSRGRGSGRCGGSFSSGQAIRLPPAGSWTAASACSTPGSSRGCGSSRRFPTAPGRRPTSRLISRSASPPGTGVGAGYTSSDQVRLLGEWGLQKPQRHGASPDGGRESLLLPRSALSRQGGVNLREGLIQADLLEPWPLGMRLQGIVSPYVRWLREEGFEQRTHRL